MRKGISFIFAILTLLVAGPAQADGVQQDGGYANVTVDRSTPE